METLWFFLSCISVCFALLLVYVAEVITLKKKKKRSKGKQKACLNAVVFFTGHMSKCHNRQLFIYIEMLQEKARLRWWDSQSALAALVA